MDDIQRIVLDIVFKVTRAQSFSPVSIHRLLQYSSLYVVGGAP
jgi:hypothetical protein